jgi:hypothetical protein
MATYRGWGTINDMFINSSADEYVRLERACIAISQELGLAIGPRCCWTCGLTLLLDEGSEDPDPMYCDRCASVRWRERVRVDIDELRERLRLGAMTWAEIEAEQEEWRQKYMATNSAALDMKYYAQGLFSRNVI